jgi:hypothetical protein
MILPVGNTAASTRIYQLQRLPCTARETPVLRDGEERPCSPLNATQKLAVFDLIRHKRDGDSAVLCAFDLIELDGEDLRRSSVEYRRRKVAKLVTRSAHLGICSMSITRATAKSFLSTLQARLRGQLCRSGSARFIVPGARRIG